MQNLPTNFSWVLAENCSCPVAENSCYRPEHYSKPRVCVHKTISNILTFLEQPVSPISSIKWVYFLLIAIIAIQLCMFLVWIVERYVSGLRGKQQRRRQHQERIFAPDLRVSRRRVRRPIDPKDIGPPLPLHCRVTADKVEVHQIEPKEMKVKGKIDVKENGEKREVNKGKKYCV
uniref:Uncharacterized protein n=1 Tax=Meloidogyne hapla TaxID=6305 RepID=A0A1I8B4Z0_MELHA